MIAARLVARLAACLIPLALIAACGRVESAPSSRLVPEWFVGDGGRVPRYVESPLYRGGIADGGTLYDTTLQVSCAVVATADGKLRCIPDEVERLEFGDAGCTQPIVSSTNTAPPAPYALEYAPCGGVAHVYAVGAPIAPGPAYARQPTECVPSYPEDLKEPRYALEEIPLERFAAVTEETTPSPNRLQERAWVTEDGVRVRIGAKDTALGAPCSAAWEPLSGESVCLPSRAATVNSSYFGDAACTRPVLDVRETTCPEASLRPVVRYTPRGTHACDAYHYAARTAASTPAATEYRVDPLGGGCEVVAPLHPAPSYEIGPAVPLAPLTTRLDGPESARLRPYVTDDGHGLALATGRFRDTAAGFDCLPYPDYKPGAGDRLSTLSFICMPPDLGWRPEELFTDAACTQPIELAGERTCASPRRAVFQIVDSQVAIRPLGAPFTGPLYRVYPKEGCVREEYWGRVGLTPRRVGPPERTLPLAPLTLSR